jgi:hypothetical protein
MATPIISTHPLGSFALAYVEQRSAVFSSINLIQLDQAEQQDWQ